MREYILTERQESIIQNVNRIGITDTEELTRKKFVTKKYTDIVVVEWGNSILLCPFVANKHCFLSPLDLMEYNIPVIMFDIIVGVINPEQDLMIKGTPLKWIKLQYTNIEVVNLE